MGTCTSSPKGKKQRVTKKLLSQKWKQIQNYTFDAQYFQYLVEIQENFSDITGGYLLPNRLALLFYEFKRFLYILAIHCQENETASVFIPPGLVGRGHKANDSQAGMMISQDSNVEQSIDDVTQNMPQKKQQPIIHFNPIKLPPSPIIDRLWRTLICNTRLYEKFCNQIFNGIVDRSSIELKDHDAYQNLTQKWYVKIFEQEAEYYIWQPYGYEYTFHRGIYGFVYMQHSDFQTFAEQFQSKNQKAYYYSNKLVQKMYFIQISKLRNLHRLDYDGVRGRVTGGKIEEDEKCNEDHDGDMIVIGQDNSQDNSQFSVDEVIPEMVEKKAEEPVQKKVAFGSKPDHLMGSMIQVNLDPAEDDKIVPEQESSFMSQIGAQNAKRLAVSVGQRNLDPDLDDDIVPEEESISYMQQNVDGDGENKRQVGVIVGQRNLDPDLDDDIVPEEESISYMQENIDGDEQNIKQVQEVQKVQEKVEEQKQEVIDRSNEQGEKLQKEENDEVEGNKPDEKKPKHKFRDDEDDDDDDDYEVVSYKKNTEFDFNKKKQNGEGGVQYNREGDQKDREQNISILEEEKKIIEENQDIEDVDENKSKEINKEQKDQNDQKGLNDDGDSKKEKQDQEEDTKQALEEVIDVPIQNYQGNQIGSDDEDQDNNDIEGNRLLQQINTMKQNWKEIKRNLITKIRAQPIPDFLFTNFIAQVNTTNRLCHQIFNDYRRFMLLRQLAKDRQTIIYSKFIKFAWDTHICEMPAYRRFCFNLFGSFEHSQHLPRQATDQLKENYSNTLKAYQAVFHRKPNPIIWPDVEERFDYQTQYSSKFYDIRGFMSEKFNLLFEKYKKRFQKQQKKVKVGYIKKRKDSVKNMRFYRSPSMGQQYRSEEVTGIELHFDESFTHDRDLSVSVDQSHDKVIQLRKEQNFTQEAYNGENMSEEMQFSETQKVVQVQEQTEMKKEGEEEEQERGEILNQGADRDYQIQKVEEIGQEQN